MVAKRTLNYKFMLIGCKISLIRPSKYLFILILNWKVITWSMCKKTDGQSPIQALTCTSDASIQSNFRPDLLN